MNSFTGFQIALAARAMIRHCEKGFAGGIGLALQTATTLNDVQRLVNAFPNLIEEYLKIENAEIMYSINSVDESHELSVGEKLL